MPHQDQDQKKTFELDQIRLKAEKIANQLCFIQESLRGLARNGVQGPQLYPVAIRGLCQQLGELEEKASFIVGHSCSLLGLELDTVAEEWQ